MEVNYSMKTNSENRKTFIKPELEIILFEGELATGDLIINSSFGNPDGDDGDI